jgi:hypothetical protein
VLFTGPRALLRELYRLPAKGITRRVRIRATKTKAEIKSTGLNVFVGFEESVDILKISL